MIDKREGDDILTRELETVDAMFMVRKCMKCKKNECIDCYKTKSPKKIEKELTTA